MSSAEGKAWTHDRIAALTVDGPITVLDVGPGVGTYAKLLHDVPVARITGLEVWAPYVETYRLHEFYDEIVIGDVRTVELPSADVIILGDVLEHMTREEALRVWQRAGETARRAVYLSIPIVHYPQHEIEGNPFEVHVEEDWSHERVLTELEGVGVFQVSSEVGAYERLTGHDGAPGRPGDAAS